MWPEMAVPKACSCGRLLLQLLGARAAVASGGKFANGAPTAAMAHLFNQERLAQTAKRRLEVFLFDPGRVLDSVSWFGHAAVRVDDTFYSFGPKGMYISGGSYLQRNLAFRGGERYLLGTLTNEQIGKTESYLAACSKDYSAFSCNCTTPIQDALSHIGINVRTAIMPTGLAMTLNRSGLVTSHHSFTSMAGARKYTPFLDLRNSP